MTLIKIIKTKLIMNNLMKLLKQSNNRMIYKYILNLRIQFNTHMTTQ
jgi:hypothetical protein